MTRRLQILPGPGAVTKVAADTIVGISRQAISERGRFTIALSGGSTPRDLYSLLAQSPYAGAVDWSHVVVFWGDERCVPPGHDASCYRMAHATLLAHVPVPTAHIHRIAGELEPARAAEEYATTLKDEFGDGWPGLDLMLLGMGEDGHTASLFPHTPVLSETRQSVMAVHVLTNAYPDRITLTAPAINAAAMILFLVTGASKANTAQRVLEGPYKPDDLPAQLIRPTDGEAVWLLDVAAASQLQLT